MTSMLPQDRQRVIEFFVHDVYMPKVVQAVGAFLDRQIPKIKQEVLLSLQTGREVRLPPVQLDLREANETLVKHMCDYEILVTNKKPVCKNGGTK